MPSKIISFQSVTVAPFFNIKKNNSQQLLELIYVISALFLLRHSKIDKTEMMCLSMEITVSNK